MKINTGTMWAAVNEWGDVIHVDRLRSQVIGYACRVFDRASYEAAVTQAKRGNVHFTHAATKAEAKVWRRLREKYGLRAVKVTVNEIAATEPPEQQGPDQMSDDMPTVITATKADLDAFSGGYWEGEFPGTQYVRKDAVEGASWDKAMERAAEIVMRHPNAAPRLIKNLLLAERYSK